MYQVTTISEKLFTVEQLFGESIRHSWRYENGTKALQRVSTNMVPCVQGKRSRRVWHTIKAANIKKCNKSIELITSSRFTLFFPNFCAVLILALL